VYGTNRIAVFIVHLCRLSYRGFLPEKPCDESTNVYECTNVECVCDTHDDLVEKFDVNKDLGGKK